MEAIYHVFNKSLSGVKVFNDEDEFLRMVSEIRYYCAGRPQIKFSQFLKLKKDRRSSFSIEKAGVRKRKIVDVLAYCLMPNHIHLVIKELKENGLPEFVNNILNSYTRYFNVRYERKGTLWEGKSKKVLIETEEQLLHLTRYIHLNPVAAYLVERPEEWPASSYREYLESGSAEHGTICNYSEHLNINPYTYKKFVEEGIVYQRQMAQIKKLLTEE